MTEVTRRERIRAATELEIRQHARALLVSLGRDAVTLRAIARELGITAPALYRYYNSREDLLRQLCDDICADLANTLTRQLEPVNSDDYPAKVFTVCRAFRQWALGHPQEFTLVFASPAASAGPPRPDAPDTGDSKTPAQHDQFASVFLGVVGPLMAESAMAGGAIKVRSEQVPSELRGDLTTDQEALANAFSTEGIDVPPEALGPDAVYLLLRWWVRMYGHIALEVFGRFPFAVNHADRLFDSLLHELARDVGLDQN